MPSTHAHCSVIDTLNALLHWRTGLGSNCSLAMVYLDDTDSFNDNDLCELCAECDALVVVICSLSGSGVCIDLVNSAQTSNLIQMFYQRDKPCALFVPKKKAYKLTLNNYVKLVLFNDVVPETLPMNMRARYTSLLQFYVRLAFVIRPKVIFIDHHQTEEIWCMQHALSHLWIHTGISNRQNTYYLNQLRKDANDLTLGQVFSLATNMSYDYGHKFLKTYNVQATKISGKYVLTRDDITAVLFKAKIAYVKEKKNQKVYSFLESCYTMYSRFLAPLSVVKKSITIMNECWSQLEMDFMIWVRPEMSVSIIQHHTFYGPYLPFIDQSIGKCYVYRLKIQNVLDLHIVEFDPNISASLNRTYSSKCCI